MEYVGKLCIGFTPEQKLFFERYCQAKRIDLQFRETENETRYYRLPLIQAHLLPQEDAEPLLPVGPEDCYLAYPVDEFSQHDIDFTTDWVDVTEQPAQ